MDFNEIKELIGLINSSDLSYFEIKNENNYIKMDKSITRNYINPNNDAIDINSLNKLAVTESLDKLELQDSNLNNINTTNINSPTNNSMDDNIEIDCDYIKSPIVGTYYEATSPDADPFVKVGQKISEGEVVCIVEAMKLMNEISAEFDCEVISVVGKNGEMVEYGEPLFKVRRI